jgi:hypothetical protein
MRRWPHLPMNWQNLCWRVFRGFPIVRVEFNNDELILTLVSLIRAVDPKLLRHGQDGFTLDFGTLERKEGPSADERLLLRLRGALDSASEQNTYGLELSGVDRQRLAETLERLDRLQTWPDDVLAMSTGLQTRLLAGD